MSRMTAAQVIAAGEYLEPDFDPASLTVNQLLGVFGYHSINFPVPYTKPPLVQLFNDEIKTNAAKLKKERARKESSIASDSGITDGVTGKPLTERALAPRRSSRRVSRAPTEEEQAEGPVRPDPPKRRRSSAQPTLGGPSKRKAPVEPALLEESEPEELPARKVGRTKKSTDDATKQVRNALEQFAEDSGWEDNNVFQSGAESSSPARPSPAKARPARKSAAAKPTIAPRRGRKATSAPPQLPQSPTRGKAQDGRFGPPQSDFSPQLSPEVKREVQAMIRGKPTAGPSFEPRPLAAMPSMVKEEEEPDENEVLIADDDPFIDHAPQVEQVVEEAGPPASNDDEEKEESEAEQEESQTSAISKRIAEGGRQVARRTATSRVGPAFLQLMLAFAVLVFGAGMKEFKSESAAIGFCDTGSGTNDVLEQRKLTHAAIEACNAVDSPYLHPRPIADVNASGDAEDAEVVDTTACPAPPFVELPHPTTCTPCPAHASCSRHTVVCDNGYLLRPHPLLSFLPPPPPSSPSAASDSPVSSGSELVWRAVAAVTDGMPGLGPVAFPPRCLEDPQRDRNIGLLGKAVKALLAQERGRRVCTGEQDGVIVEKADGGDARKWGMEVEALRDAMKRKTPANMMTTFDTTFHEAIQQIVQWGGVVTGEDSEGKKYLARETPDLTWNCALTVKARNTWREWRNNVVGAFVLLIASFLAKQRRAARRIEDKRVGELVQIALDTLRNQELAHYTDPASAPYPYLSSLQLRDLVLQDEHSVPARRRLWDRVERVVEGNANVRANLEEVAGGDELRVWRWIGGGGRRQIQE